MCCRHERSPGAVGIVCAVLFLLGSGRFFRQHIVADCGFPDADVYLADLPADHKHGTLLSVRGN